MTAMVFSFAGLSGSKIVFVLEQRDGFARGLQRQLAVRSQPTMRVGFIGINIRIVEQSHLEFPIQHRRDQFVELRFLQNSFADQFDQVQITIRLGKFDVHAGFDRQRAGLLFVLRDEMAVRVGPMAAIPRSHNNPRRQIP